MASSPPHTAGLVLVAAACVCARAADIWLTGILPYTGGAWDAGMGMVAGGDLMLEQINAHPTLLSGHTLKIVWQDGMCNKDATTDVFMTNLFAKQYRAFAPGVPTSALDRDGDDIITTEDVRPFQQTWNRTQVSPDPIGVVGPGCSSGTSNIVKVCYIARYHLISPSATFPHLSDRTEYPNFYRTILPDTFFIPAWLAMAKLLGQMSVAVVIGETGNFGSMGARVVTEASRIGLAMVGNDLSGEVPGLHGLQISTDSQAAAREVALELVRLKRRVVVQVTYAARARLVLCEAYKVGLRHAVFMYHGWFANGWWAYNEIGCTVDNLRSMAMGLITANMKFWRHDDDTLLSCSERMTARDFKEELWRRYGNPVGDLSKLPEGYVPRHEAGTTADAVCMYAMMLHKLLLVDRVPLADLVQRTQAAYDASQAALAATDFEGLQARVRYGPNEADPKGTIVVEQLQASATQEAVMIEIADFNIDSYSMIFLGNDLVFGLPGERFPAGAGDNNVNASLRQYADCPRGQILDMSTNLCMDCAENQVFMPILGICVCDKGFASSPADPSTCIHCAQGYFAGTPGQLECMACPAGSITTELGQTECQRCSRGVFQNETGKSTCRSCDEVLLGGTTEFIGVQDSSFCLCSVGTYTQDRVCEECGRGMDCSELGMMAPKTAPGFMISPEDAAHRNFSVYRCRNRAECPLAEAGTCPQRRAGIGCAYCEVGFLADDSGICVECSGAPWAPPALGLCVCSLVLVAMVFNSRTDVAKTSLNTMMVGVSSGQIVTALQMMTVLSVLKVPWVEPVKSFLKMASVFAFRIDMLNMTCFVRENVVALLLVKLIMVPIILVILSVLLIVRGKILGRRVHVDSIVNVVGVVIMIVYMSMALVSVAPFQCLHSPNDTQSMASNPSVLCWKDADHICLSILGACGVAVYPVGFFAWMTWVTVQYPKKMARGEGFHILSRYRFLFQRFEVSRYYYAPMYLLRSFLLALVPVAFPNYGHRQLFIFGAILLLCFSVQAYLQPWRGRVPNMLDMAISGCVALVINCAALLPSDDDSSSDLILSDISIILSILIVAVLAAMIAALAFLAHARIFRKKRFLAFLSHHKLGCQAGARMMKIELQSRSHGRQVFLDSDDLDSLDNVLEYVRTCTQTILVMLTAQTLWRPWCAGEIATAYLNNVRCVCIRYDDYTEPTGDELEELDGKFQPEAFAPISMQGVSMDDVRGAYEWIRQLPKIEVRRLGFEHNSDKIVYLDFMDEVGASLGLGAMGRGSDISVHYEVPVPVIASNTDAEAVSTAQIIAVMVQRSTQRATKVAFDPEDLDPGVASHAVVLLSPGCLEAHAWARTLIAVRRERAAELCVMRVPEFQFPSQALLESTIYPKVAKALQEDVGDVSSIYNEMMCILALAFSPGERIAVIEAQIGNLASRMLGETAVLKSSALRMKLDVGRVASDKAKCARPDDRLQLKCKEAERQEKDQEVIAVGLDLRGPYASMLI